VTVLKLFMDFNKREVLYSICSEFSISVKLVRLHKTCSNETYSKVHIDKNLSDGFPTQNDQKT
jgi:hypothetical protein